MARIYDYWLGGASALAGDRLVAAAIEDAFPLPLPSRASVPVRMARDSRAFMIRAARYCAEQGCGQFVKLAAGLPPPKTYPGLYTTVRHVRPGARVAYVDNWPASIRHTAARIRDLEDVALIPGDFRQPGDVLEALEDSGVIDLDEPWCAILPQVLQFNAADEAAKITAAYAGAMPKGSFLVISTPRVASPAVWERVRAACTAGEARNHTAPDLFGMFAGTELAEPGLVVAGAWRPDGPADPSPGGSGFVFAGVGRVR
jgi:hypothetical protein